VIHASYEPIALAQRCPQRLEQIVFQLEHGSALLAHEVMVPLGTDELEAPNTAPEIGLGHQPKLYPQVQVPVDRREVDIRVLSPNHIVDLLGGAMTTQPRQRGKHGEALACHPLTRLA